MKKFTAPIILALSLGLFLIILMVTSPSQASPTQPVATNLVGADIYTSRQMQEGIVSTSNQSIFGPNICTAFGDPYSPLNSRYTPGIYTYRYRIEIPPDYEQKARTNYLRVELFDPDSINSENNSDTIRRTDAAVTAGGLSAFFSASCNNSDRKDACLVDTGEAPIGNPVGGLDLNQVNPFWFMRVDENRGAGSAPGNGACGEPGNYNPGFNTQTRFELYYNRENVDGSETRTPLASYTGQAGDNYRDNGGHETDLYWVSPGANVSFAWDKTTGNLVVPADPGTRTERGFEIDLSREVPNIVTDPATGNRYIYLDVTALSGASENGFEIWAGPEYYTGSVPSNVNERNIWILNSPRSHRSYGVNVFAMGNLPLNSNVHYRIDMPITYLTPEQAGESVYISTFDMDAGAQPPVEFYLDSMAEEDWSLTFANGGVDPDGITSTLRCQPGSCNDMWIGPAYEIKLPKGTQDCDFSNPTAEECTPFYGGRLYARVKNGAGDTHAWQVTISQNETHDPTTGCEAFPIGIHEGIRSVTQNTYPSASEFDSANPPVYNSFIHHVDNQPLLQATEGTVFKIQNGFGSGTFGWLSWNTGINASASTLQNSLTWPGNSLDYTNHNDGGQVLPGQSHVVRGYIEAGDSSDTNLHPGDWIATGSGSVNSAGLRNTLQEHIDLGRTLRLPIWDVSQGSGNNGAYRASAFALFRIQGYKFSQAGGGSWILLELIRFDDSCGQTYVPLTEIEIEGATRSLPNEGVSFTAHSLPLYTSRPITYTWEATDFAPITQSNGISDTVTFNWAMTGTKTITVTAVNAHSTVTDVHTILVSDLVEGRDMTIIGTPQLVTPLPLKAGEPVTFAVTIKNVGDTAVSTWYYLSLFVNPATINADGIPIAESDASKNILGLDPGASKTIEITLNDGLALPTAGTPHQIYAMVDAEKDVLEVNETNNVSSPTSLSVDDFVKAVTAVSIDGNTTTYLNETLTFTADILPLDTTQPVSYTWEATDFAPVTHSSGISDTITFNWATPGSKTIAVTAQNAGGSVSDTHTVIVSDLVQGKDLIIVGAPKLITPLPIAEGDPVTFEITIRNVGTEAIASHWFVDLFVNPDTINPDGISAVESKGFTTLSALDSGESKTVSITLKDGLSMSNSPHQIYAMVDTFKTISEVNETNNISEPLPFGANNFLEWSYLYLPTILKP